jgi:hypothetical protein
MSVNPTESCLDCGTPLELTLAGQKKNHVINVGRIEEKGNICKSIVQLLRTRILPWPVDKR